MNVGYLINLGVVYMRLGQWLRARDIMHQALHYEPENHYARKYLKEINNNINKTKLYVKAVSGYNLDRFDDVL